MNKENLKKSWGKYCDTDKLVDDMMALLRQHRIRNSEHGVCCMFNKYFQNKQSLIELFANSPNYAGNMRIALDVEMNRYADKNSVSNFMAYFPRNVEAEKAIIKFADSEGKKLADYIKVGFKTVTVDDIVKGNIKSANFGKWSEVFEPTGKTRDSSRRFSEFNSIMNVLYSYSSATINDSMRRHIDGYNKELKIAEGTKTSRAFNKICHEYGVDNMPKYNKLFAEYADMVSPGKRNVKFYISVNPLDYITMSVGRSWNSCHAPGHGYFAGTVSYMLDSTSIITFVHDQNTNDIVNEGKIYRNMLFYHENTLLQSRVYPQGNDGCTDLYAEFRSIVQKEFAEMLGLENKWNAATHPLTIDSFGRHYKDYNYGRNTNVSFIGKAQSRGMRIGHTNVCPYCGREEDLGSNRIAHSSCSI